MRLLGRTKRARIRRQLTDLVCPLPEAIALRAMSALDQLAASSALELTSKRLLGGDALLAKQLAGRTHQSVE